MKKGKREHVSSIYEVFKTQGVPTVTYVDRDNGAYERQLAQSLRSRGLLCVLTGSSKTGKTTLYSKVAEESHRTIVRIPCNSELGLREIWTKALEQLHHTRVVEQSHTGRKEIAASGELGGQVGFPVFAGISGKSSAEVKRGREFRTTTKIISGEPSPEHLIPLLQHSEALLVFEDYHYLRPEVQNPLFQQWKLLVDEEVSILVVGTTHHAADLAQSNTDLIGRVAHIDLPSWHAQDLAQIARKGLHYLGVSIEDTHIEQIARESVGLPIITQAVLLQLLVNKGINDVQRMTEELELEPHEIYATLHNVARSRYNGFQLLYERLARGPREQRRKFNTYELILSTFGLDPISFSLSKRELLARVLELPVDPDMRPPGSAVTASLRGLSTVQDTLRVQLLEWNESHQKLYIIEPTFLFFLRWWKPRETPPVAAQAVREMLEYLRDLYSDAVYD